MKTETKNVNGSDCLVITIPLQTPRESSTGKSLIVATGSGKTDCVVNGKQVSVTVNAYIKP